MSVASMTPRSVHMGGGERGDVGDAGSTTGCPIERMGGRWWVLHTKARNEKALAAFLCERDIGYFLPLSRIARTYGRRSVQVEMPLFPGYLFMCGGEEDRYAALSTNRVANVLRAPNQSTLREELMQVYRAVNSDTPVDLFPGIRAGRRCRVKQGSLAGLEGVVVRRRGVCRLYIAVEVLGQSAEVEIDSVRIELID